MPSGDDGGSDIRKPPEDSKDRPNSTLDEQEVLHLPSGEILPVTWTTLEKDPESVRWTKTKHTAPIELLRKCANPWNDHGHRHFFNGYGGKETDAKTPLCNECIEKNDNKKKIRDIFFIGWLIDFVWDLEICE